MLSMNTWITPAEISMLWNCSAKIGAEFKWQKARNLSEPSCFVSIATANGYNCYKWKRKDMCHSSTIQPVSDAPFGLQRRPALSALLATAIVPPSHFQAILLGAWCALDCAVAYMMAGGWIATNLSSNFRRPLRCHDLFSNCSTTSKVSSISRLPSP